jgi:hypothetical protein
VDGLGPIDPGTAGRSAEREAERWRTRRAAEKASRPRFVRSLLGPSAQEKRLAEREKQWVTGAQGEEMLAQSLARRCPAVIMLHDRRIPHSRVNIDHIAVAPSGVYVIDAKRYRGKIEVRSPLFGKPKLMIAGRDRTKLIDGLQRQVEIVTAALSDVAPNVPLHGCLCFLAPEGLLADSGLPVLRTLKINGLPLYYPRRLTKHLNRPGPISPDHAIEIATTLADRLHRA